MRVDRPFLFAISDRGTGNIIFLGKIERPLWLNVQKWNVCFCCLSECLVRLLSFFSSLPHAHQSAIKDRHGNHVWLLSHELSGCFFSVRPKCKTQGTCSSLSLPSPSPLLWLLTPSSIKTAVSVTCFNFQPTKVEISFRWRWKALHYQKCHYESLPSQGRSNRNHQRIRHPRWDPDWRLMDAFD